jgi:phospholipase/carboxylesterase
VIAKTIIPGTTGFFMPSTDLSWRLFRPAEGFYTSEVHHPRRLPIRTFLPTGYEPNYAYPLLVFFHGHGGNEEQILRLAPRLSRRNYICIGLRGPERLGPRKDGRMGYTWRLDGSGDSLLEDYLLRAVEQTRRSYHVHSERIYLAGFCEGATLAYRLGLTFPERLAGVISLNGAMQRRGRPLFRLPEIRQLRVFIGHGIANALVPLPLARDDFRLFYTAGLNVELHTYAATHRLHPNMLRDINRWIITQCNED